MVGLYEGYPENNAQPGLRPLCALGVISISSCVLVQDSMWQPSKQPVAATIEWNGRYSGCHVFLDVKALLWYT